MPFEWPPARLKMNCLVVLLLEPRWSPQLEGGVWVLSLPHHPLLLWASPMELPTVERRRSPLWACHRDP